MNLVLDARSVNHFVVPVTAQIDSITIENGLDGQVVTLLFVQDKTGHSVAVGSGNLQNFVTPGASPLAVTAESFVCNAQANTWVNTGGLSGKIQTIRAPHTVTQDEVTAMEAHIPITWPVPFADANYTVTWSIEDTIEAVESDYVPGDSHQIAAAGFLAVILIGIATVPAPGSLLNIHAIGIHD